MVHMADFPAFWTAIAEDGFYEEVIFCYSPSLHSPSPLPPFDSVGRVAVIMTVHIFPFLCTACPPSHILQLPPSVSYCTSIASHRIISDLHAMLRCSAHAHAHAHNGPLGSTSEESLGHCVEARFNQPARSCNDADACWESECAWGQSAEHGQPNCRCPGELLRCHPLLPHEVSKSETSAALGDIEPSRERESERTSSCATEKNCNNHTDLLLLILEHENVPYCRSQRLPSKWRRMLEQPLRNSLCWRECVWCHVIPYLRLSSLTVTPSTRRFLYKNDTTCALRFNYWLKF